MKNHFIKLSILLCIWIIGMSTANADGRRVTIVTRDGSSLTGELISIRPHELLLYTGREEISDETLLRDPKYATNIPLSNIESVYSEGESHVVNGMLIGAGIGLFVGVAIAKESASKTNAFDLGFFGGIAAGTLAGIAASSSDFDLRAFDSKELMQLAQCSRFPDQGRAGYNVSTAASKYGFTFDDHARILSILPGSPGFVADLHFKDRIVSVDARAIPVGSLSDILKLVNVGDSLNVTVQRDGKILDKKLVR